MTIREQKSSNTFVTNMIYKLLNINKWKRTFLIKIFILFCLFADEFISYSLQGMENINIKNNDIASILKSALIF